MCWALPDLQQHLWPRTPLQPNWRKPENSICESRITAQLIYPIRLPFVEVKLNTHYIECLTTTHLH